MPLTHTLKQMKDQLIGAFASMDAWLDSDAASRAFLHFDNLLEKFIFILYKNDNTLSVDFNETDVEQKTSLLNLLLAFRAKENTNARISLARTKLRDQLFDALVLLEEIEQKLMETDEGREEIDMLASAIEAMHARLKELYKMEEAAC
jgi:hypothetical protein